MFNINYQNIEKDIEKDLEVIKLRNKMNSLNKARLRKEGDLKNKNNDDDLYYIPNVNCRGSF